MTDTFNFGPESGVEKIDEISCGRIWENLHKGMIFLNVQKLFWDRLSMNFQVFPSQTNSYSQV